MSRLNTLIKFLSLVFVSILKYSKWEMSLLMLEVCSPAIFFLERLNHEPFLYFLKWVQIYLFYFYFCVLWCLNCPVIGGVVEVINSTQFDSVLFVYFIGCYIGQAKPFKPNMFLNLVTCAASKFDIYNATERMCS